MESINWEWRKSVPPFLSTSHCECNGAHSCTHIQQPDSLFTQDFINFAESITSLLKLVCPIFWFLSKNFLHSHFFFLFLFLYFHRTIFVALHSLFSLHIFRGLAGACVNPRIFIFKLLFCTYTCLSKYSRISSWISTSVLLPCMFYQSNNFSA